MIDQYGRNIDYMRISITNQCNLQCSYCMPPGSRCPEREEQLSFEEWLRLCKIAVSLGIVKFKITGGEPLIRPECVRFISTLKGLKGVEQVTMTTNGTLFATYAKALCESGIDSINISMDAITQRTYEVVIGTNTYKSEQILSYIPMLLQQGIKVKVNVVLLEQTKTEIPKLAQLAKEEVIDVRFIEVMPIGAGRKETLISSKETMMVLQEYWTDLELLQEQQGSGPARYYGSKQLKGRIGMIDAMSHSFCESCNRIRLLSNGRVKPCLAQEVSLDLRQLLRSDASEEEIRQQLKEAIFYKPVSHHFHEQKENEEIHMSQIGG